MPQLRPDSAKKKKKKKLVALHFLCPSHDPVHEQGLFWADFNSDEGNRRGEDRQGDRRNWEPWNRPSPDCLPASGLSNKREINFELV